nr:dihydrofolate reductase family protein [Alloactinosynnema sp. L-07]
MSRQFDQSNGDGRHRGLGSQSWGPTACRVRRRPRQERGQTIKLTVHTFVSFDGVMQGPGAPEEDPSGGFTLGGWLVPHVDDDFGRVVDHWFGHADEILLGRSTYDMMYPFWSQITEPDNVVATKLNMLPKHVVSTTLTDPAWNNTTVIASDVVAAVAALKDRPGRELQVHGSWRLVRTLHDAGLVDEYRVLVFPVVLGMGKRLFPEGATPSGLTLVHSEATSTGVTYHVLLPRPLTAGTITIEDGAEVLHTP